MRLVSLIGFGCYNVHVRAGSRPVEQRINPAIPDTVNKFLFSEVSPGSLPVESDEIYWGREYVVKHYGSDFSKYFSALLRDVLVSLESIPEAATFLEKLADFRLTHGDFSYLGVALDDDSWSHDRLEVYESFVTAIVVVRDLSDADDRLLRLGVAKNLLEHADEAEEEFDWCYDYCSKHSDAFQGLSCADNFDAFKILNALGEIQGDARYGQYIDSLRSSSKSVASSFELQVSLSCITTPLNEFLEGFKEDLSWIPEATDEAIRQLSYA
jgi:hypothetical protein